jgi:hypothetical protein
MRSRRWECVSGIYGTGKEGIETGYTALEGIKMWLWDIWSGRRGYRGEENNENVVIEHRDWIREWDNALGVVSV